MKKQQLSTSPTDTYITPNSDSVSITRTVSKINLILLVLFTIIISGAIFGFVGYNLGKQQPSNDRQDTLTPTPISQTVLHSPEATPSPTADILAINWGKYNNCTLYSRSNLNTYETNTNTLPNSSEIRCEDTNSVQTILSITDNKEFLTAKNSIYRFWHDNEGYKVLLVDQSGAGSGEGSGKVLLLTDGSYQLLSCFYFSWGDFYAENVPMRFDGPLSSEDKTIISQKSMDHTDPSCSNFTLKSEVE